MTAKWGICHLEVVGIVLIVRVLLCCFEGCDRCDSEKQKSWYTRVRESVESCIASSLSSSSRASRASSSSSLSSLSRPSSSSRASSPSRASSSSRASSFSRASRKSLPLTSNV